MLLQLVIYQFYSCKWHSSMWFTFTGLEKTISFLESPPPPRILNYVESPELFRQPLMTCKIACICMHTWERKIMNIVTIFKGHMIPNIEIIDFSGNLKCISFINSECHIVTLYLPISRQGNDYQQWYKTSL